jgi:hypothetical protein
MSTSLSTLKEKPMHSNHYNHDDNDDEIPNGDDESKFRN